MSTSRAFILLSHLQVQNVNTISSSITWGFPSIAAILGFVHALERKAQGLKNFKGIKFIAAGVVCHYFEAQVHSPAGNYQKQFALARKPLNRDGTTAAMNEEGRAHIEVSILIQLQGEDLPISPEIYDTYAEELLELVYTLRIAGGSIIPDINYLPQTSYFTWIDDAEGQAKKTREIIAKLLPGFALVSRQDLLQQRTRKLKEIDSDKTAFDALLELSSLNYTAKLLNSDDNTKKAKWLMQSKQGWIVPIPVGYQAISELYPPNTIKDARDQITSFRFVENIYSIAEWLNPKKIVNIADILWRYEVNAAEDLYQCTNEFYKRLGDENGK